MKACRSLRCTSLGLAALTAGLIATAPTSAEACGGFFCDNVTPVVQTAERVLFRINTEDATTTVIVEVQYEGPPSDFGWILPVAAGITTDDIGTAPAGLFDALEEKTAPVFERPAEAYGAGIDEEGCGIRGCNWRGGDDDSWNTGPPPPPDTSGVEVIGEAVVGPYAVELIQAQSGQNLSNWLIVNGYQISPQAIEPMDHYIGAGMAFIGLKLTADVPAGPIDAISFTVPGTVPSLPLILTSIAAAQDMEIVTYVAGPGRYVPGNGSDIDFDYDSVEWTDDEETDYQDKLTQALGDIGQPWNTEFAAVIGEVTSIQDTVIDEVLDRDDYVNRYHTFLSPDQMDEDPYWQASASAADVDNHHVLYDYYGGELRSPGTSPPLAGMIMFLPLLLIIPRRRRA